MMPNNILYRKWCKKCNDYTVHNHIDSTFVCKYCNTTYTNVRLNQIPEGIRDIQKKRYRSSKISAISNLLLHNEHNEEHYTLIEDDAGAEQELEYRKKLLERRREAIRVLREEYIKFKHLGRNDLCACGSSKKYKKCCISKYKNL